MMSEERERERERERKNNTENISRTTLQYQPSHMYVYVYMCMYVYVCMCMYFMYVYVCVCMYVCMYAPLVYEDYEPSHPNRLLSYGLVAVVWCVCVCVLALPSSVSALAPYTNSTHVPCLSVFEGLQRHSHAN